MLFQFFTYILHILLLFHKTSCSKPESKYQIFYKYLPTTLNEEDYDSIIRYDATKKLYKLQSLVNSHYVNHKYILQTFVFSDINLEIIHNHLLFFKVTKAYLLFNDDEKIIFTDILLALYCSFKKVISDKALHLLSQYTLTNKIQIFNCFASLLHNPYFYWAFIANPPSTKKGISVEIINNTYAFTVGGSILYEPIDVRHLTEIRLVKIEGDSQTKENKLRYLENIFAVYMNTLFSINLIHPANIAIIINGLLSIKLKFYCVSDLLKNLILLFADKLKEEYKKELCKILTNESSSMKRLIIWIISNPKCVVSWSLYKALFHIKKFEFTIPDHLPIQDKINIILYTITGNPPEHCIIIDDITRILYNKSNIDIMAWLCHRLALECHHKEWEMLITEIKKLKDDTRLLYLRYIIDGIGNIYLLPINKIYDILFLLCTLIKNKDMHQDIYFLQSYMINNVLSCISPYTDFFYMRLKVLLMAHNLQLIICEDESAVSKNNKTIILNAIKKYGRLKVKDNVDILNQSGISLDFLFL
ncbi:hypothetical protein TCON_0112 [Astathelohania contejeani]|uniref:Uncharacterized protein n=1 Tax=Astathelohania contejeani TaxID=164912 RepID=A0ABQ7I2J3_9MICR|nr:hypothetical protein TCON_0112 [Thelohania contejeani]